ncbi:LysR family transcriptional regulator, partial [Xanthomonas hortorum]
MTLTQLRYLVAIADAELNITLAAARVHATQPGLSKQLKQLEDELGFLLFVRKGRSLDAVTPAGVEVIERARS